MPVISATQRSTNGRIPVWDSLGIKQEPISEITKAKRAGGVIQMVEHLPSKCRALHSTPRPEKQNEFQHNFRTYKKEHLTVPLKSLKNTTSEYMEN
jgi:hypothetical protein